MVLYRITGRNVTGNFEGNFGPCRLETSSSVLFNLVTEELNADCAIMIML